MLRDSSLFSTGDTSVPSPPSDIQFAVSSTERVPVITASWSPLNCRSNPPNCIEPLGYIMTCSAAESKLSTTVWLSERVELDPIRVNITGATPATRYVCKIASFNAYGVGSTGSTIFVDTPESGISYTNAIESHQSGITFNKGHSNAMIMKIAITITVIMNKMNLCINI